MLYDVSISEARKIYSEFEFVKALTPSAQKAAFHVRRGGQDLCLKLIAPNYGRERLDREILAMQTIRHKNVARLVEYLFESKEGIQRHYILEHFIDGLDLTDKLVPGKPWKLRTACAFFAELCDGLSALETRQIVHRDLKPSNVRVKPDGSPVLIDLGLARHLMLTDLTSTGEGAEIGTPTYFAPEQFAGTKYDIDCRTDLFAAGILLYQALVGRHPFMRPGMTRQELRDEVCQSEACFSDRSFLLLPKEIRLLIEKLMSKERANRPVSAELVSRLLRRMGGS
jgi:eukaryotic-like serine/threonine-protein kinase